MERIRQLRNEKGLSQAKLAVMADMDPATLNRLERGTGNPNLKTLERVADALGVEVVDLLGKATRRSSPEPSFNDVLEGERLEALEILFDNLRIHITGTADRWIRATETGYAFWSEDAAIAFSIEMRDEAAHLYGFVSEALEPALEGLFAGTLTLRAEQRKLIEAVEHLNRAVEMVTKAADAVAPPSEPTEEEWAAFAEVADRLWEEMDEVEQRRQLREVAEVLAAESEQAAKDLRGRIA